MITGKQYASRLMFNCTCETLHQWQWVESLPQKLEWSFWQVASSLPGADNSRFKIRSNYKHGSRPRVSSKHKCTPYLEYMSIGIELRDDQVTRLYRFQIWQHISKQEKGKPSLRSCLTITHKAQNHHLHHGWQWLAASTPNWLHQLLTVGIDKYTTQKTNFAPKEETSQVKKKSITLGVAIFTSSILPLRECCVETAFCAYKTVSWEHVTD